jgi:hypothetical protein
MHSCEFAYVFRAMGDSKFSGFEHLADSESADSLEYLKSVRNLQALLTLLELHPSCDVLPVVAYIRVPRLVPSRRLRALGYDQRKRGTNTHIGR